MGETVNSVHTSDDTSSPRLNWTPRALRIEYAGAIYHVMNRGDRRELIFRDDLDYKKFLATLAEVCTKTDWQVHAFCLLPNHFHLVVETPNANLVAGMRWFLSTYTARFNRRHKLFGHLFSGRYKALIVDGSASGYLKTVCDYVHLNPARAKLLGPEQPLREYRWSSWPEYLKRPRQRWPWLRVARMLGEYRIPKDSAAGRQQLEARLEERRAGERGADYKPLRRGWWLGGRIVPERTAGPDEGTTGGRALWGGATGDDGSARGSGRGGGDETAALG